MGGLGGLYATPWRAKTPLRLGTLLRDWKSGVLCGLSHKHQPNQHLHSEEHQAGFDQSVHRSFGASSPIEALPIPGFVSNAPVEAVN